MGRDYSWPTLGYNIPWSCLTKTEQEACEVYMLGRVMWCIFEARSAPQRAAGLAVVPLGNLWSSFQVTRCTPQPIRDLIDRCTRGATPGLTRLIVREGNQLGAAQVREHRPVDRQGGPGDGARMVEARDQAVDEVALREERRDGEWNLEGELLRQAFVARGSRRT